MKTVSNSKPFSRALAKCVARGRLFGYAVALVLVVPALIGRADGATGLPSVPADLLALARDAVTAACSEAAPSASEMARRWSATALENATPVEGRSDTGWRRRFALASGGELTVVRFAPGGYLRRITVRYDAPFGTTVRPQLLAVAGGDCLIRFGRRLRYASSGSAQAVEMLDATLKATGSLSPLNPAVPAGSDPGGVRVAMVDAGVNYLLPAIAERLARDDQGRPLGFDFWELDDRPFDANPARSPFFPQRHGTRTASLLLTEAPVVALVPYRYPRPDMARMRALVDDAAAKGVVIMNLSLGSRRLSEWQPFFLAATAHPDMLFVVSAGNDGRNIDHDPVYPAAFSLANLITVTSADDEGRTAAGSNWGARAVDLRVPAEQMLTTEFSGAPVLVSGSSYAAVRVSALAACLLAANPSWRAPELKAAIFATSDTDGGVRSREVAQGLLLDPVARRRGPCPAARTDVARLQSFPASAEDGTGRNQLAVTMAILEGSGWMPDDAVAVARRAREILAQCDVGLSVQAIEVLAVPKRLQYFHRRLAGVLVREAALPKPTVFLVKDTLDQPAFEAQTFGLANTGAMPLLRDTLWMTRSVAHPGIALAHEIVHLLTDSGRHVVLTDNLMQARTAPQNVKLTAAQCERMVDTARKRGLLHSAS